MTESEGDLRLRLEGALADAVRSAARDAGISPSEWAARAVIAQLSPMAATGPETAPRAPMPVSIADQLSDPAAWESVVDETMGAGVVDLPRGWRNRAWVARPGQPSMRSASESTSPDGSVTFRISDPDIPIFREPGLLTFPSPGVTVAPAMSADQFVQQWAQTRYGALEGFRITAVEPMNGFAEHAAMRARSQGAQPRFATAARATVATTDGATPLRAVVLAYTVGVPGMWFADVSLVESTSEDPETLVSALEKAASSPRLTGRGSDVLAQQRAAQDASHRATMSGIAQQTAAMTARHHQNMAGIEQSAQAHQERMQSMWQSHDAASASWSASQQSMDSQHAATMDGLRAGAAVGSDGAPDQQHLDFLNAVKEERTVVDSEGHEHQVEAGHDTYYYRRHDESWIALDRHHDIHDVPGINPDDYEQVQIKS